MRVSLTTGSCGLWQVGTMLSHSHSLATTKDSNLLYLLNFFKILPSRALTRTAGELAIHSNRHAACFCAERTLELAASWLYAHNLAFTLPYRTALRASIHTASLRLQVGEALFSKAKLADVLTETPERVVA